MSKRTVILTIAWTIAFAIALSFDTTIAEYVHTSGLGHHVEGTRWAQAIKAPGDFRFTIGAALLLLIVRQIRWKQAVFVLLAGAIGGANPLIKWIVGRTRPYKLPGTYELRPFTLHPFWHGIRGFAHQKDLCFPSGHECNAGALAAAMFVVWPKGWRIFLTLAVLVGIERVMENAHYASDVVGAMGFVMLGTAMLYRVLSNWMQPAQPRGFEVVTGDSQPEPSESST